MNRSREKENGVKEGGVTTTESEKEKEDCGNGTKKKMRRRINNIRAENDFCYR